MHSSKKIENGLEDRKREEKIGLWILGVAGFFLTSFFLAPLTVSSDTINSLSGRANVFDYATKDGWGSWGNKQLANDNDRVDAKIFAWSEINPYAAVIYAFGDLNCHNKHERSWNLNGNQLPVCTRNIGIFLGAALAGIFFFRRGLNRWTIRDTMLSTLPTITQEWIYSNNQRNLIVCSLAAICILPLVLDGGIQALTSYESTHLLRLITGLPFGFFIMLLFGSSLAAKPKLFGLDASSVILPAGVRFSLKDKSLDENIEESE